MVRDTKLRGQPGDVEGCLNLHLLEGKERYSIS